MAYFVGEKFHNYLQAAEKDADFRDEVSAFTAEIACPRRSANMPVRENLEHPISYHAPATPCTSCGARIDGQRILPARIRHEAVRSLRHADEAINRSLT